jgi:transposase
LYIELTNQERAALEAAIAQERRVRQWRRYQAIRLLADGQSPRTVASMLSVSLASIYNWVMAWRTQGPDGMREQPHTGRAHRLGAAAEQLLVAWLADKPRKYGYQVTSWTVPLLQRQLALAGHSVSERTLRRTLHRLGWRWRDGAYVPARPGAGSPPPPAASERDGRTMSRRDHDRPGPAAKPPGARGDRPSPPSDAAFQFHVTTP